MELEEAKKILNVFNNRCKSCTEEFCDGCYVDDEDVEAISTVLQEIEHLQKENEELKDIDLTTVHIKGVCDEKDRWKNKIKEKLKELEFSEIAYGRRSIGKTLSYGKKIGKLEVLTDLLKEE